MPDTPSPDTPSPDTPLTVTCSRCGKTAPPAAAVTWGGKLGAEIRARVCAACWAEWEKAEVMVINELRLDFMDPASQDKLAAQLRQFLVLD